MRRLLVLALVVPLTGCATWSWRVPSLRYSPTSAEVPVHTDRTIADLAPESYAIGSTEEEGPELTSVSARIAATARRHGAHAVLLGKQEAVVSSWTTVRRESGVERHETGRQETLNVESARVFALGIGYRAPARCIGAHLVCEPTVAPMADTATCLVRVRGFVPDGPLVSARVEEGEGIVSIDGNLVSSPSDVYQWVDQSTGPVTLQVSGELGQRAVNVTPGTCAELYPRAR
mgnify:CR=1 FL=1